MAQNPFRRSYDLFQQQQMYNMADQNPPYDPYGQYPRDPYAPQEPLPYDPYGELNPNQTEVGNQPNVDQYKPETQATDRFNRMMDEYPIRHKPSILRRIGTALAGLAPGGNTIAESEAMLYPGRSMDVEDWKNKINPAEGAMTQERLGNYNVQSGRLREAGLRNQSAALQSRADIAAANNASREKIAQSRLDWEKLKLDPKYAEWEKYAVAGGNLMYVNPRDPKQHIDTGVPTNTLSDTDKFMNKIKEIDRAGFYRLQAADISRNQNITTTTTVNEPPKADTGTQAKSRAEYNAERLMGDRSDLAPFIHIDDKTHIVTIDEPDPSKGFTWQHRDYIIRQVFGGTIQQPTGPRTSTTTRQSTPQSNAPVLPSAPGSDTFGIR